MNAEPGSTLPPKDPFDKLDARDGYHVVRIEYPSLISVSSVVYADGDPVSLVEDDPENVFTTLKEYFKPTPAQSGESVRLYLVLDAVARYLTTGGSWDELAEALQLLKRTAPGGLVFAGYHLLDSYSTTEGTYQHIFVKDGTVECVLWEEPTYNSSGGVIGGFIDRTTLDEIREGQENDETIWGPRKEKAEEAPRPPDRLQLPPAQHHDSADEPA